jgi:hypothetical protein
MSAVPFDTLRYVHVLKAAGVPEAQAEAQAEALADVLRQGGQGLATTAALHALGLDIKREMAELKADLIKWNVGAIIAMTGLFTAIVKWL